MNCSMTKADTDGSVTAGSLLVEVAQYAHIHLEINHEVKANGHMKTNVLCGVDEKSASVDLETTTTVTDLNSNARNYKNSLHSIGGGTFDRISENETSYRFAE